nr:dnaJ homolog subfamily B member 9-like [Megalopta genalis]
MLKQYTSLKCIKVSLSTKSKTHYDTLKISPKATHNEIKSAYYKLTLEYHPDRNKSKEAKATFQNISSAYQTLSNFQLRKQYDRTIAIKYADINKIQRPIEHEYTEKTMNKMYDYDEWLRSHYGQSFDKSKMKRRRYDDYLIFKRSAMESNKRADAYNKTAIIIAFIAIILSYITDRKIVKYDQPKDKDD